MKKLKFIGVAVALALAPATAFAADCCAGKECCKDGADCCKDMKKGGDNADHHMSGMQQK
jgi:hypothetical protein